MIGQHPVHVRAVIVGEDLVGAGAEQITMGDLGSAAGLRQAVGVVDLQMDVVALVEVVLDRALVDGLDAAGIMPVLSDRQTDVLSDISAHLCRHLWTSLEKRPGPPAYVKNFLRMPLTPRALSGKWHPPELATGAA